MKKIGILLGSARKNGNNHGMESWLLEQFKKNDATGVAEFEVVHIYPHAPMHPLGPLVEDIVPAMVTSVDMYPDQKVQEWSKLVDSCDGFIILTPQYNWGYPGDLKNAFDHLFKEWSNKPVLIISYGGHGGNKCAEQLKQVLTGLKMKVVEEAINITLPSDYIRTSQRVNAQADSNGDKEFPLFLREQETKAGELIEKLKHLLR